ncbi:MAG: GGDEF domain-containing protein [Actinomycetota bacterium]|nr:GGDEF domain-containing protein [Actinomycetota bacterium]
MVRLALLLVVAIGYAEITGRVELVRRYIDPDARKVWTNYTSVWAFAGVLVLPAGYAGLLTAAVYAHALLLGHRSWAVRPHRLIFTGATMVLAALAAGEVLSRATHPVHPWDGPVAALAVGAAIVVFWLANISVLVTGMYLAVRPPRFAELLPHRAGIAFEYVTLSLGVVAGEFVMHSVWLTPLVVVLIATTHRSSLVSDLRVAASTDAKTGLLNAMSWRERARQSLSYAGRTGQPACVLVLDLDHFKAVNDEFGHLAGDQVLVRVADTLRTEVRDHDVVGRFGGEEFVIVLDAASLDSALSIAERLRERIAAGRSGPVTQVTASIGVAYSARAHGITLDEMLEAADHALYAAKAAGRDRVQTVQMSAARAA